MITPDSYCNVCEHRYSCEKLEQLYEFEKKLTVFMLEHQPEDVEVEMNVAIVVCAVDEDSETYW